jgi:hypothetical protein
MLDGFSGRIRLARNLFTAQNDILRVPLTPKTRPTDAGVKGVSFLFAI